MHDDHRPRGIAVVDVGFTNSKVILYDAQLRPVAERKMISPHSDGAHYREIDVASIIAFARGALGELDQIMPIDSIVTSSHGACVVCIDASGAITVPVMDYMSNPPPHITTAYHQMMPAYTEVYTPPLPVALLQGMQLFWQQQVLPEDFAHTATIMPLMQYLSFALGGRPVIEISGMSCQSHLMDLRNNTPSSLARRLGWDKLYAPLANAWDVIGQFCPPSFQGRGMVLTGIHDSSANLLRYLAAGQSHFTLLSTGTWIIAFDTDADVTALDPTRDIVANKNIFGQTVACSRFFGGKEFEVLAGDAAVAMPSFADVQNLISAGTMALPSFTNSGGPMPGTGERGRLVGPPAVTHETRASLAAVYCALMVSESLDALTSKGHIIVDGPFSQNSVFLGVLAALRPSQQVLASAARDGTAAGAACLALMLNGILPNVSVAMSTITPPTLQGLKKYQLAWRHAASRSFTA